MNRYLDSLKSPRDAIRIRKVSISSSRANTSRSQSKSKQSLKAVESTSPSKKKQKNYLIINNSDNPDSCLEEDSVIMTLNDLLSPSKPRTLLRQDTENPKFHLKPSISKASHEFFFNKRKTFQK